MHQGGIVLVQTKMITCIPRYPSKSEAAGPEDRILLKMFYDDLNHFVSYPFLRFNGGSS